MSDGGYLTPREWLEDDAVPVTPDVDLFDPVQRSAWIRANNEEMYAREMDRQARLGVAGPDGAGSDGPGSDSPGRRSSTTVVAVRVLNAEQRALVRMARREDVTVSDLLRRWARAALAEANGEDDRHDGPVEHDDRTEREREIDERAQDRAALRQAMGEAADAAVERIADELRRLREIVATAG